MQADIYVEGWCQSLYYVRKAIVFWEEVAILRNPEKKGQEKLER